MNMANEIKIGATLTVIFVAIIFLLYPRNNEQAILRTSAPPEVTPTSTIKTYSLKQISVHNRQNDCWLIINNNIYDATNYLFSHPGGVSTVTPYCGTEATVPFEGMRKHLSGRAQTDLTSLLIGTLQ